ncbi:DsbA family protein [Patescibacteria group bacterium]|nr:DsbA family protein [Patescibacteria group bacterium]MBP9710634.1 DsbA family protein [Patescibacteria group bacterium]
MENQSFWAGSPKSMFYMGLFLGVAVTTTLALASMLGMAWSGKSMMGGVQGNQVAQLPSAPAPAADPNIPQPTIPSKPVKEVGAEDHIRGNKNAKVTLIVYSDYECPFCKRHEPSIAQALKDFPNDVRIVHRHYPLTSIHPNAQKAAEAAECANKLGGNDTFWKMHDKIFAAGSLSNDGFVTMAKELGVNEANFKKCLDSGEMAARVDADVASGNDSGVEGTPATFINGQLVSGAVPYASMKSQIQAAGAAK